MKNLLQSMANANRLMKYTGNKGKLDLLGKHSEFHGKITAKYLECGIFRILLKQVSSHLSVFFQFACLYL